MPIDLAAVFRTAVRQDTTQGNLVRGEKGQHPIVQQIGGRDRRLFPRLANADLGVRVDEGRLIDPTDALKVAHVEGVLRAAVTGALALEFPVSFHVALRTLERGELRLREDATVLRRLCVQRLQALLHGRQIMAQPHAAYSAGGNGSPRLGSFVRDARLAPGGLLDGEGDDHVLQFTPDPITPTPPPSS